MPLFEQIVVDDVIAPLWVTGEAGAVIFPNDTTGKFNTFAQIISAPLWSAHSDASNPPGTSGANATWGPGVHVWPPKKDIQSVVNQGIKAGKRLDWDALYPWFTERFFAYRANTSNVFTIAEVKAKLNESMVA